MRPEVQRICESVAECFSNEHPNDVQQALCKLLGGIAGQVLMTVEDKQERERYFEDSLKLFNMTIIHAYRHFIEWKEKN
jgi:hypothetical protein